MKETIEKQILEWQQEIINQRQYILRLEGGVQAYQLLLKEIDKPKEVKEKVSYGDYCNDPNIKTFIQTAKNIAIGRMAVAIQRKKGNFRN